MDGFRASFRRYEKVYPLCRPSAYAWSFSPRRSIAANFLRAGCPCFRPLCRLNAPAECVAVSLVELLKEGARFGIPSQSGDQFLRRLHVPGAAVCRVPSAVSFRSLDLGQTRRMHFPFLNQLFDLFDIGFGPKASSPAWRKALQKERLVTSTPLPVDPTVAQGYDQRFLVTH